MKKSLLVAVALSLGFAAKAQTYSPIAVTGYTADVVAEGTGTVASVTNNDVDGVNYNFMAAGYTNPANATTTRGLPATGLITTVVAATPGLTFQLAPYSANNSLRINGAGNGTLTFPAPAAAEKVYVLATSGSGTSIATITVTFTDASTQVFTQTINDWYGGTGFAIQGIGRVNRTDNTIDNNTTDPRLYQYELALKIGNTTKQIQSISFSNTGAVLNIMGISIKNSAAPAQTDAGILAVVSPVSPLMQNTSQPVQVTLVNQGTSPLTSATITWTVDGVAQTNYTWTGNLAFNQTATVTLGNFTFTPGSHTVNACATNPNGGTDGFAANDCSSITLNSCNILAGVYTIDKNSAVSATNFQTIASAITAMSSCGISGPVTFNVTAGTGPYTEQVEIPAIIGASATNTITFNGNGNTISADPVTGTRHVIKLNGAKYVTINNFTIATTGTTTSSYGWGIHFINGANNNTISNNTINIGSISTTESNSGGIIFSNSTTIATTTGDNGNNNLITSNTITGGYKGIGLYGLNNSVGNNQITGNTIKDYYSSGIELNGAKLTLVENNDLSRPVRATVPTSTSVSYGIILAGTTQGSTISKNRIHNTHDAATTPTGTMYGIYSNSNDAPVGLENIVKNNLFYNFSNTGIQYGLYNSGSDGVYYYHNTVSLDKTTNTSTARGFYQTTAATNIRFMNNIINIVGGTTGTKHAIYYGTTTSNIKSNFNDLYLTGGASTSGVGSFGTTNKVLLTDWQTASGDDSVSVSADPAFTIIANANVLPTASAVNNIGRPVTPAVIDDYAGTVRNTATPDPGAYEFSVAATPTSDAGVSAISGPNSGCALTNQEIITITINNFGTAALSNIPVSYTINNGTPVTETFAGPLAASATGTYSFTTKADLSVAGTYNIEARTNFTGDVLATNDASTKVVTAAASPVIPTITAGGATTFCTGGSVVLTAASTTTGATYTWFLNGTAISGTTAATYTANAAGNYTAVANANGCSSAASAATAVTVNAAPAIPTITAGGATTFCSGGSVTLTAATTTTTGATFAWFLNGTAITGATAATYTANASGSYTVVATNTGCNATSTATTVTVNTLAATPTITAGGSTTFCTGGSVTLTAASTTTGATFQWLLNGTPISGATSASYTANAAGSYTVVASANSCPSPASAATTLTINTPASTPTITAGGATTLCTGGSVVLTAASTISGATYQWFLNGNAISGATNATYTANAAGSYTAIATANGCPSSASTATAVTVNAAPAIPTITAGGSTTICSGNSVALTAASTTTGVTYTWFLNGTAITGANTATYSANAAGTYTVNATIGGCSATATATAVTVNATPATPTITQNGGVLTSSAATGNQWYLNGTLITGATGQVYTSTANGTYTVIATANGCSSAASAPVNMIATGLTSDLAGVSVSVYPNPNQGKFDVKLTGYNQKATIYLYNLAGQLIRSQVVNATTNEVITPMHIENLAAGTYLLKVTFDKAVKVERMIVE